MISVKDKGNLCHFIVCVTLSSFLDRNLYLLEWWLKVRLYTPSLDTFFKATIIKEIHFYQEMEEEHHVQDSGKGFSPLKITILILYLFL